MPYLYILQSQTTRRYYVGSTTDLPRRLAEHARGHSHYTQNRGPWKLMYREEFASLAEARRREAQIKGWKSHRMIAEFIETWARLEIPVRGDGPVPHGELDSTHKQPLLTPSDSGQSFCRAYSG